MIDANKFGMNFAVKFYDYEGEAFQLLIGTKPIGDGKCSEKIYEMAQSVILIFIFMIKSKILLSTDFLFTWN